MSLGNNIHIKRKETGITQEDLANRLGVSRQAVSDWERDVKKPETQNLINLAKLLDASLDWLCADELVVAEHRVTRFVSNAKNSWRAKQMERL